MNLGGKVLALDPGKQRDSFGILAAKREGDNFLILNATRVLKRDYLDVEKQIADLHKTAKYDRIILEINNVGIAVQEVLVRIYNLPVIGVTTIRETKDLEKKASYEVMEKNEMVRNMIHWFQEGRIKFPKNTNTELEELKRQLAIFAEHRTDAGNVTYHALGTEHDDLVMALMLALWWLRGQSYSSLAIDINGKIINPNRERKSSLIIQTESFE